MTLAELSQRLGRADFLDGLGIYVGPHEVAVAHLAKRFFQVRLAHAATFPLPGRDRPAERFQALADAVGSFAREHKIDARRTYLCVSRTEAAFSRAILPAAARENLHQVLEYEIENLIPLPKDEVWYDYSVRDIGDDRIQVLLMCLPRQVAQGYLDALEGVDVRPRGIVLASTAIADYLAFCRGPADGPVGVLVGTDGAAEFAVVNQGRLVASQLVPTGRPGASQTIARSVSRELAEVAVAPDDVHIYRWDMANGSGPLLPPVGDEDLAALAQGKLDAGPEFFATHDRALLPAVGAALGAVREGTVPINLLQIEGRRGLETGLGITTLVLVAVVGLLLFGWGASAIVKDELLRRQVRRELDAIQPQVREVKALQADIESLEKKISILTGGQDVRATQVLREVTQLVPTDAHLTTFNLRGGKLTMDGMAGKASELIPILDKSKLFRNVNFTSPTTRSGDKERFSIVAEVDK